MVSSASQRPFPLSSASQDPPQTPKASSWLPSQSQSPFWDVGATAFVNLAWAVAHATGVEFTNTGVYVVADAVAVLVGGAVTPAFAHHVKLVAVAVAISLGDVRASAFVDGAWSVANATCIDKSEALFLDVADAVFVHVLLAETTTHTDRVKLVAVAVAVSGRDAVATADAALVKDVAVAVAISFWDVRTTAFVDRARSVADATSVEFTDARVDVVADAVAVGVGLAWPTALAECVKLVAVAVAISCRDV